MLTGRYPFTGASTSDIIVGILERDPDLGLLPAATPARVRWLLKRCLQKDPDRRLHDIADARIELEEALAQPESSSSMDVAAPRAAMRERAAWLTAAIALVALMAVILLNRPAPAGVNDAAAVFRSALMLPPNLKLTMVDPATRFALSPDGRRLALVAADGSGVQMLWVRPLDSLVAQPVPGTEGASYPFWSPDSRSIGFIARPPAQAGLGAGGLLRKVDLGGGEPVTLASRVFNATGAWGPGNTILFTPTGNSALVRISATAPAEPVAVGTLDPEAGDVQHSFPSFLPDGRHYIYTALGSRTGANEARGVYLASLDGTDPPQLLIEAGSQGRYASGHILFLRDARLLAQRFDPETRQLAGEAVPVAQGVQITPRISGGTGAFSVSDTGVLVYQTGVGVRSQLGWIDRSGKVLAQIGEQADYVDVALSPDGSRALVSALDPQLGTRDLLVYDADRGIRERLTSEPSDDYAPVWSPRGDRIAFTSARAGSIELYERALDGSRSERRLESGGSRLGKFAAAWSPDGRVLLFIAGGRALARSDIHAVQVDGIEPPRPLLESPAVETQVKFSRDGRWIAYAANDSGRMEVYVRPFPGPAAPIRVSVGGGGWARWGANELFFLAGSGPPVDLVTVMAAPLVEASGALKIGEARPLFKTRVRPMARLDAYSYDVTPDGRKFLFNTFVEEATSTGLTLVVNWPERGK
jgi:Tol biopolymer transport system component